MGIQGRIALIFISLICNCPAWAQNPKPNQRATLNVRGIPLQLPFEIRILVETHSENSVEIGGYKIQAGGKTLPTDEMKCSPTALFGSIKEKLIQNPLSAEGPQWICKSKSWQKEIGITPTRIRAAAGFLSVNEKLYRGEIEIFSKNKKLNIINSLPLEPYLAGLVNKEIRSDYPEEAVKAQVIAARSYAVATAAERRSRGWLFDMYGTEADQVYEGSLSEDARSHRMVRDTLGEVLFHQEDILKAYYHAANGGFSELPQNVWIGEGEERDRLAYLARPSPIDAKHTPTRWQVSISPRMGSLMPGKLGDIKNIRVVEVTKGQRVRKILVERQYGIQTLNGPEFRGLFGNRWIKSTYFKIQKIGSNWLVQGKGFGHGVGLSQLGAKAMGKKGKNHRDILSFYYPYSNVRKIELGEDLYIAAPGAENNQIPPPLAR